MNTRMEMRIEPTGMSGVTECTCREATRDDLERSRMPDCSMRVPARGSANSAEHKTAPNSSRTRMGFTGSRVRRLIHAAVSGSALFCGLSCAGIDTGPWSPEDGTMLFMSDRDGKPDIYVQHGIRGSWTKLTRGDAAGNWPQWSPDGNRIAFQSNMRGNLDIWVMNADGSNPVQLTTDSAHDYLPSWSPDGTQLTFASWRREPGDDTPAVHIYVMNADGSSQKRLVPESPGTSAGAQWSPDGSGFLLPRRIGEKGSALFFIDRSGRVVRRLTDDSYSNGAPTFSPDGTRIAFHCDRGDESDIVVMNRDGGHRRAVVSGGRNWYPRWSPDGRWLTYTAAAPDGGDDNLDIMATLVDEEGTPIRIAHGPHREAEGSWRPRQ